MPFSKLPSYQLLQQPRPPALQDMFAFTALVALASAALPKVLAHGGVLAYSNAGNWYQGWAVSGSSKRDLIV